MIMSTEDIDEWSPQGPVTELSVEHCYKLLDGTTFGRLGVSVDNQPEIFPVNGPTEIRGREFERELRLTIKPA